MTGLIVAAGFGVLFSFFMWREYQVMAMVRRVILLDLRLRLTQEGWSTGPEIIARVGLPAHRFYPAFRSLEREGLIRHAETEGGPGRAGRPLFHYALTVAGKAEADRILHEYSDWARGA